MRSVVRLALEVVQDIPTLEIALQLARFQTLVCRGFTRFGNVDDCQQYPSRRHPRLADSNRPRCKIVANGNQIPSGRLDPVLAALKVRNPGIDMYGSLRSPLSEDFNRNRRTVHGRNAPAMLG